MSLCQRLCPTRGSTVEVHSNKRIGGRHSQQGSRKNKVCLFKGEDGDDEESVSVAEVNSIGSFNATVSSGSAMGSMMQHIERELQYRCSSDSGSVMGKNVVDEGKEVKHQ